VPRIASRRFVLALVAYVLPASLFAAPSDPAETPAKPSLKGQLLIATSAMRDPRFEHAVILIWYTAPADPGLVFDDDRDKVWEHATAHRTQDL
jgi:putative AlgH/UPF0301 family transcriptional regulator